MTMSSCWKEMATVILSCSSWNLRKKISRFMFFMCSFPTRHRMDQVATQHHKLWPGSELVYGLHSLLGELHLLSPFLPSAIAVAVPPSLHKPQLGVCGLDEAKWSPPVALCIWNKKRQQWTQRLCRPRPAPDITKTKVLYLKPLYMI